MVLMMIGMSFFSIPVCSMNKVKSGPPEDKVRETEFKVIGFHLDLRIQVMKPEALHVLAGELAEFGINTLIMEWEGTFPYESHPMIPNRYAYTKEEISSFVNYCQSLGIDVIPLQQSFGHVEYILRHYQYAEMREDQTHLIDAEAAMFFFYTEHYYAESLKVIEEQLEKLDTEFQKPEIQALIESQ